MTQPIIFRTCFFISLVLLISLTAYSVSTTSKNEKKGIDISAISTDIKHARSGSVPAMNIPDANMKATSHKTHLMKIDELGKIHRFHKERVKKVKKAHGKMWFVAIGIVVCCHIALLIHAFMHLAH